MKVSQCYVRFQTFHVDLLMLFWASLIKIQVLFVIIGHMALVGRARSTRHRHLYKISFGVLSHLSKYIAFMTSPPSLLPSEIHRVSSVLHLSFTDLFLRGNLPQQHVLMTFSPCLHHGSSIRLFLCLSLPHHLNGFPVS